MSDKVRSYRYPYRLPIKVTPTQSTGNLVEPFEHESISHSRGRLWRFKANSLPSAYSLGQAAGIGGMTIEHQKPARSIESCV